MIGRRIRFAPPVDVLSRRTPVGVERRWLTASVASLIVVSAGATSASKKVHAS
jgi:hypothetical protein